MSGLARWVVAVGSGMPGKGAAYGRVALCNSGGMVEWDTGAPVGSAAADGGAVLVGVRESGAVEAALAGIADLQDVPPAEHVARFDAVHRALADALSAIDGN
jgi:hypothetical protein